MTILRGSAMMAAVSFGWFRERIGRWDRRSICRRVSRLCGRCREVRSGSNSLPMSMAVSPDARYVVTVNAGYGTFESRYMQSLAVLDTQTGTLADFPDDRNGAGAKQTLYSGLAFSQDGRHLYASMGSATDPVGDERGDDGQRCGGVWVQ